MARGFRAAVGSTNASGAFTMQSIQGGSSGRLWIRAVTAGITTGGPADLESNFYIDRITAIGTASAVGSTNIGCDDLADVGTEKASVFKEHAGEPTYSSRPFYHQRFNHRVKEHIELLPGREWVIPQTASAGMGLRITSTGASTGLSCISWNE